MWGSKARSENTRDVKENAEIEEVEQVEGRPTK